MCTSTLSLEHLRALTELPELEAAYGRLCREEVGGSERQGGRGGRRRRRAGGLECVISPLQGETRAELELLLEQRGALEGKVAALHRMG